jgi:hypothetical protein
MHLPRSQWKDATLFVKPGLPNVNAVVVLKQNGFVFPPDSVSDQRFPGDLAKAVKENRKLEWGMELGAGAKIRILTYQTFPQFKQHSDELFILVLIVTDSGI